MLMQPTGELLLHGRARRGGGAPFAARDPRRDQPLPGTFHAASAADVVEAVQLAAAAAPELLRLPRAALLRAIAAAIDELGEALLQRCQQETALPLTRLQNERARTVAQLQRFAALLDDGSHVDARIDHGDPHRQPPKPDLRSWLVPLGPVAVFGASNFPLAFSVAGGDTASALAAGCPVVVKAHPAHPGSSELVGRAVQRALAATKAPPGAFALLHDAGHDVGRWLVTAPQLRGCGFTGSFVGGKALLALANARPQPIPLFAEMGSANPVVVLPQAARQDATALAAQLAGSALLAGGQFCTSPGIVLLPSGVDGDAVATALRPHYAGSALPMVHADIARGFAAASAALRRLHGVEVLAAAEPGALPAFAAPLLLQATVPAFVQHEALRHEVYGPCLLLVRFRDRAELLAAIDALDGHLTGTLHGSADELQQYQDVVELLASKVGRLLCGGVPTGVEVAPAMQHGGPWPASSDARFTSVGPAAIRRWLRPLCYQDAPPSLLPEALRDDNPLRLWRTVDGVLGRH